MVIGKAKLTTFCALLICSSAVLLLQSRWVHSFLLHSWSSPRILDILLENWDSAWRSWWRKDWFSSRTCETRGLEVSWELDLLCMYGTVTHHNNKVMGSHNVGPKRVLHTDIQILMNFEPSQNSNLNTSLERPFKELLNGYFSFEIRQSKCKL